MDEEIAGLKAKMEIITVRNIVGVDFYLGKMHGKNVVLVRSGMGKVNAAICAQVLIDIYGVDCIINTGAAGAISKELKLGDVVISEELLHHDMDCTAIGVQPGVIPGMKESFFKADATLIRLAQEACEATVACALTAQDKSVYTGKIVTGDQFVSGSERKSFIWNNFNALCTEMEGAAIAQTCTLNKIPFVVIRVISDSADEFADITFEAFMAEAANTSGMITEHVVKGI